MTKQVASPKSMRLVLLLSTILILSFGLVGSASTEGAPYVQAPGYPLYGCYDIASVGIGMFGGSTPYMQGVDIPGPVVDAYLFWIGPEDTTAPSAPDTSELNYSGTPIVGNMVDRKLHGTNNPEWFMWRANVGPAGYNLVSQGLHKFTITGWDTAVGDGGQNGASLVVIYSTGNCARPRQINLIDNMDYYWENEPGEVTTAPMIFTFPPVLEKQEVTVWLHHAGTYHLKPCRPEAVWALSGTGTPPAEVSTWGLINYGSPSTPLNGGRLVVDNAFNSSACASTLSYWPVVGMQGWVDGVGPSQNVGGYVSGEWSVVRLQVEIPEGTSWLALQAESTMTGSADPTASGESGAWFAQAAVPVYNPELRVAKDDGVDLTDPGATLTYTIDYENYGYGPAAGTVIVDTLPDYATFVSASNGGVYSAVDGTVTWDLGTLDIGASGQLNVVVDLDPVFPAGTTTLTNVVEISTTSPGEQDTSDNQDSDTTDVFAYVELDVAKVAAPEPVEAGAELTYTIDWSVGGNAFAPGVTIVDELPDLVSYVSASDFGVYDPATHTIKWTLGDVTPLLTGTHTIVVLVDTPLYNETLLENAVVLADTIGDSADSAIVSTVHADHELQIAKVASPDPVEAGGQLTYTIDWAVTGNEPSPNATVVETLPALTTFVGASDGGVYDDATHTVTWSLGEVMTPDSGTFTVVVDVDTPLYNGTILTNVVDFMDDDAGTPAVQATLDTTVHSDHELSISKTDSPDPVEKGGELTYVINWGVTGNEPADNVVITDPLPFGTQFVSASGGGIFDPVTNLITWDLGIILTPESGSVTLVVKVNRDFVNGLDILNYVTIADDTPGKEQEARADTAVVQTAEGWIGDTVWYDSNGNGIQEPGEPGIAGVGLVLYDAGLDAACGTADDAPLGNRVTDANGKYRFNETGAGTYCVDVLDATLPPSVVLTGGNDPHGPIVLEEGEVYRDADFGFGPLSGTGAIGDMIWSDADGNGAQDAGEVGIGGVTLSLLAAGADGVCMTADDSTVASAATAANGSYLFTGVAPGVYCVLVTDTAGQLAGLTLTGGTNPHGPITLASGGTYLDADFGYQGLGGQVGDFIFYDGNRNGVYEPGPTERGIPGVTLDLVAAGPDGLFGTADDLVLGSATTDADGDYLFSGLPDGAYQVVVTDLGGRLLGYTQTYGVPGADNNGQTSPYAVTVAGGGAVLTADFGFADGHLLTVSKSNDVPAGLPVEAGADMVYTIQYSASGREAAPNVLLKDLLPMQVDFVSASDGGVYDPVTRLVTWSLGDLEPGATGFVTLTVHVKKPLPNNSFIFNNVVIVDDARVTDEANNSVRVHAEPILSLTKTNDPTGEVKPGDAIEYTLCWSNTGNGNATNVTLTDGIPTFTTYVEGSGEGSPVYDAAARQLTWSLGTVGPDAQGCTSFSVAVDMTIPGVTEVNQGWTVDNIAHLDSTEKPRLTASVSNPLNATVKLTVSKANDPVGEVLPGETIEYELCYANNGTANATGVVLTDIIPTYTKYVAGSATGGAVYSEGDTKLTWNVGVLGPTVSACVQFAVEIDMTIEGLTGQAAALSFAEWNSLSIDNTVVLGSDQLPDKSASVSNPLNATVDPAIYKSANGSIRHVGETVVFTVTVTNRGTANANDVVITDAIHPKLENVTLTASKGTTAYDAATRLWTVTVGLLAPDETVTIVITGTVIRVEAVELPFQITNTAQVAFREGAPRQSNEVVIDVVYLFPGEIPEASTWLLLGSGLAGLAGYAQMRVRARRRKEK